MQDRAKAIVVFGAGAVGCSVAGWIHERYPHVALFARGEQAEAIRARGLVLAMQGEPPPAAPLRIPVIEDLSQQPAPAIVVIAVKNYDLRAAAQAVKAAYDDRPLIIGLQNGVENQRILPLYFSKIVFGVVCFNAWIESPGVVGAEKRGPILFGTLNGDPELAARMREALEIFKLGLNADVAQSFQDTVHAKLILNLTNSIMTLSGHKFREIGNLRILKKITLGALNEGIEIVQAAGYKEAPIPGAPRWRIIKLAGMLPDFVSDRVFRAFLAAMGLNSMAQDILVRRKTVTEIDSLDGYFVEMANRNGLRVPIIRAMHRLGKERFTRPDFAPLDVEELWQAIQKGS